MADDNKQRTHSVIIKITLSIQLFHHQVFMEHQLPIFIPGSLENTWQAQNRPVIEDFMRRLEKQVNKESH